MALPNLLSLSFLVPFVAAKLDFSQAIRGLRGMPRRLLLVGQKSGAGVAQLGRIITVSNEADAILQFGNGSMLLAMWRAAKANADLGLPIDVCAIAAPAGGTAATLNFTLTNSAGAGATFTSAGEAFVYIAGTRVSVAVTTADTQATLATKFIAAINAIYPALPVTAAATANTNEVRLTARWVGVTGNEIDFISSYYPEDRQATGLTVSQPGFAGGAGVPDLTVLVDSMVGYRATEIVCPFVDAGSMAVLEAELATRWAANNMQDGTVINSVRGTEGEITAFLANRRSPHVHTIVTGAQRTTPWETAAMAGAVIESQAAIDPALPHTGLPLLGYKGPRRAEAFTVDQMNNFLAAGGSPLQILPDYSGTLLRMVTNYTATPLGAPDRSMAELAWIKTMSYYRWYHVTEFQTRYVGFKLAQYITDPIPGQKIMTRELAEEIMLGVYKLFADVALVQNLPYYKQTLVVEIDAPNGKLKIKDEPVIVTQHYQTEITSYVVAGAV